MRMGHSDSTGMRPRRNRSARKGSITIELLAAVVVLGILLTAVSQLAVLSAAQHRELEERMLAVCEASCILEQVTALPYNDLTPERLGEFALALESQAALPEGRVTVSVEDAAGSPPGKRLSVEISWQTRSGQPARPVRLKTWRFATGDSP